MRLLWIYEDGRTVFSGKRAGKVQQSVDLNVHNRTRKTTRTKRGGGGGTVALTPLNPAKIVKDEARGDGFSAPI